MAYGKAGDWYINNVEGGGTKYETVFEGNVTTVQGDPFISGDIIGFEGTNADTIKVTFNGIEYTCNKIIVGGGIFYGGVGESGPDFSEYPFAISDSALYTETAGTYSLKIEEPQSGGGSSDFSTATMTYNLINRNNFTVAMLDEVNGATYTNISSTDGKAKVILYKGKAVGTWSGSTPPIISGDIQLINTNLYMITGDFTITQQAS